MISIKEAKRLGRKVGIDILGDVSWGTHSCLFYKTKEDLFDILVPYFKAGLESNEFCMWVTSEPLSVEEAEEILRKSVPDFDRYLEKGQVQIIPHSDWYLKDGVFNLQKVLNAWLGRLNQALASGFAGMRVTGNGSGFEKEVRKEFADYEKDVNEAIGKYQMIAICSYCIDECGAAEVIDIVNCHQSAVIRREGKWKVVESAEHKKAKEALQVERNKLTAILDSMADGVYIVNQENDIEYINPVLQKEFGPVKEKKCYEYFHDREEVCPWCKNQEVFTGKTVRWEWYSFKNQRTYDLIDTPLRNSDGSISKLEIFRDITDRKKAEEALKASEKKYRTLLENLPQKIFLKDRNSVYLSCNENYAKDLKIKAEEIAGKADYDFYPKELAEKYRADDKRIMKSGKIEDINEKYIQNGREVVVHTVKTPVRDEKGNFAGILSIFWDITAQRRAQRKLLAYQKRLRDLASEMSLTEERERKRLAVELHDQVTQNLILFKINLGELREKNLPVELIKPVNEIYKHLDQIVGDMRSLTFDLGSPTLYELGLEAAVREYLHEEIQQKHEIKTEFEDDAQPKPLDEDVCALLYRAVRELLINVVKHAQAQYVKVSIRKDNDNIRINVVDNGIGFKPPTDGLGSDKTAGFGLFSIRERLNYFGGSVEIESKPGEGTQVALVAPIKCGKNVEKLIR